MSQEAEKTRKFVAFKKKLETRVEELESELNEHRLMLEAVNSILLEKGFKRVEIPKTPAEAEVTLVKEEQIVQPSTQPSVESEGVIPLKAVTGELLGNLYITKESLRVALAEDKNFDMNTPPFRQFLVERVLVKMQEKDNELARDGKLEPDKIFSYDIVQEENRINEIVIRNFDNNRLRELKSSIRWTLDKMYEKMKG